MKTKHTKGGDMSRKTFAKYMITEKLEQILPDYEVTDWHAPVICANCGRTDVLINFGMMRQKEVDYTASTGDVGIDFDAGPIYVKTVQCPKCRSGLAYLIHFKVIEEKPKKAKGVKRKSK